MNPEITLRAGLAVPTRHHQVVHTLTDLAPRTTLILAPAADQVITAHISLSEPVTGGPIVAGVIARATDGDNRYAAEVLFGADQRVQVQISRTVAGTTTVLAAARVHLVTYVAGMVVGLAFSVVESALQARVWNVADREPDGWQVETTDTALSGAGSCGWRSARNSLNSNTAPAISFTGSVGPYWVDLTGRLHYGAGGQAVSVSIGRQTESTDVEPTRIGVTLKNADGWLTPRNPASPWHQRWGHGTQLRLTERVAGVEVMLATTYLEMPEMTLVSPGRVQPVTCTAIDVLGVLDAAAPLEGNLAEHIRHVADERLVDWLPLSDPVPPVSAITGQPSWVRTYAGTAKGFEAVDAAGVLVAQTVAGPDGDDQSYMQWNPADNLDAGTSASATIVYPTNFTTTDQVAVSVWVRYREPTYDIATSPFLRSPGVWTFANLTDAADDFLQLNMGYEGTGADRFRKLLVRASNGGVTEQINPGRDRTFNHDQWALATLRLDVVAGILDLWIGDDYSSTLTAASLAGSAFSTDVLTLGADYEGALAHLQVRKGAPAWTREEHIAQHRHGFEGLERQTVAERVATIARYAGVPAWDVDMPNAASTPLRRPALAGQSPAAAARAAATSGQDLLITDGRGHITAVPRTRRYAQPVTMQIPFGWIESRSLKYRTDRPITDATATIPNRTTTRRSDPARRRRYGTNPRSVTLDSAVDGDATAWATWTLRTGDRPRTRIPGLRLNMLSRTPAERLQLLGIKVGDRIEVTEVPNASPDDIGDQIVQGIEHTIGPGSSRWIQFRTSPLLGPTPGQPPAGIRVGDAVVGPDTRITY
ncbi:hypothetical protein J2S43_007854 [Catenuloplanes nepalensis]|uniref:Tip attachment protein J domain-containing protein n=1 Tax=Catenuloplanes nepalensis TaxID=587533 RepID=A0ABT9N6L7_9ACTN|nr:hypothetical protein [Catenuloplanes nepalensis]MDP9799342.1 hypothetical protein [Catenuloplanes nepalensis]